MRMNRKMLLICTLGIAAICPAMRMAAETPGEKLSTAPFLVKEAASPSHRTMPRLLGLLGRSETLMPSGDVLQLGGELSGIYRNNAFIVNPLTGAMNELPAQLTYGRAWHSATLLPDGSVLVFGGIGSGDAVVDKTELLNPASTAFQAVSTSGPAGRAYHTATLLTDGRILIAGGADTNGNVLGTAVLWNYQTGAATSVQLLTPRMKHEAALLPDGTVLIWGGVDAKGNSIPYGEIIDPVSATVRSQSVLDLPADDPNPPQLETSIPANIATDVPPDAIIVLRFSKPLEMASVNTNTVVLAGPSGRVSITVVPAEAGMLAFISPAGTLESGSAYSLMLSSINDNSGQVLPNQTILFNTGSSTSAGESGGSLSLSTSDSSTSSADASIVASTPQSASGTTSSTSTESQSAAASNTSTLEPNIHSHFTVTPVPFEQMSRNVESAAAARPKANLAHAMLTGGGSSAAPEIVALANALNNDPDLIYQYVHDNIEFSPLFGILKGPVGALLDGRGDSFDQASLMVALLNQASLSNSSISNVLYEFGTLNLTNAQLQGWLGVDGNQYSVMGVLSSGGIPYTSVDSSGNAYGVGHVWVKVSINGTPYIFDPAFKSHTWKTGIVGSLPSIMGYSRSQFMADANPATLTTTSIQGVNRTQLRSDLGSYANNLSAYIKNNLPTAGVSDVIGGGVIVSTPITNGQTIRKTSNPNQSGTPTDWSSIPSSYFATLSVTLPGASAQTYNSSDIYGHRLSIFFSSSYVPTLYLDGSAVVSGSAQSHGTQVGITFSVTIPWATWANYSRTQYISAQTNQGGGSGGYIVSTGWDQVGRGMIEKHRKLLNQAIAANNASDSELVLGESLEVLGTTWLAECAAQQRIVDQLLGTTTQYFYGAGIVGESVGTSIVAPYVDLPLNFINTPARINGASTQTAKSLAAFVDASGVSSSFESATLEQTQAQVPGFVAASTVKLLDMAVQNGSTIYDINNSATGNNWSTIEQILCPNYPNSCPNYNVSDITTMGNWIANGYRVIAPSNGKIAVGAWTGVGFKALYSSGSSYSYGEIISGQLSGGFGGVDATPSQVSLDALVAETPASVSSSLGTTGVEDLQPGITASSSGQALVGDPIDHQKGSYQYSHDDMTVGSKAFPYGLNFQRVYDSNAQGTAGPLGNGWTHSYAISASVNSDGFTGMGQGSPLNAAASIAALYVSSDLMNGQALNGQNNLENYVLEAIANRWFTDQLTNNVINVQQGWNTEEFVLMADGSYSAPLGSATILRNSGASITYTTKNGVTMTFNGVPTASSPVQISSWTHAAGASVSFSYSGSGGSALLSSVTNSATGRTLTFNYSGNQISSVSDGNGRSVSYTISGGNLTKYIDALSQNTIYSYDTSGAYDTAGAGHLTQIYYPSNPSNAFVTNYYDGMGRVFKQQDALGHTSFAFIAGARTEIDDPAGDRHVWYNDPRGNVLMEIQDYGSSSHLNATTVNTYNGQGLLVSTTLPEGNSTTITAYDSLFNPLSIVQSPKAGSPLSALTTTMTYTLPVSSLPNFEEVYQVTDPKGNVTTNSYDSSHGNLTQVQQPAVSKPGAGNPTPTEYFTYTSIGLPQTAQDAEGRVTRYDYYPSNADEVQKTTVDYNTGGGHFNYVTQYGYDTYGDVNSVTDPNNTTTTSSYDALRRLNQVSAAISGSVTQYTYYPDGQVHTVAREAASSPTVTWETTTYAYTLSDKVYQVTDPLGNVTTTAYDGDDRVYTVTQPVTASQVRVGVSTYDILSRPYQVSVGSGSTTAAAVASATVQATYAYTLNGRQLSVTDANSHTTSTAYDGFDRASIATYPDATTEQLQYDADSNVTQKTTRSGQTIGFSYDALNRVSTKTPQGEVAGQVTYGYDLSGRLLQATDGSSTTPYQIGYDTAGRATSYTDQQGNNTQVAYDGAGNRTQVTWPAGTSGTGSYSVTYQYDAMNRMQYVKEGGSNNLLAQYNWDALSRTQMIAYGDGTSDAYSQYDAADNLQTLTQNYGGTDNSVTFSYAWQMNHQRASVGVSDMAFQYVPTAGTESYGPADVDNGLSTETGSLGSANLTYDGNHNLTFDGYNTLTYDVENRMVEAQNAAWGASQYLYDPLGQRKQKTVGVGSPMPVTTQFVLAGGEEIGDYYQLSQTWRLTVRGVGGLPLAAVVPAADGMSEQIVYVHHDVQGSTVALTVPGETGPAETYTYSDYGQPQSGSWSAYQYAGYRYDSETGLYYVKARYYSPVLGRFLQTDPAGFGGGFNLYAYVGNDPINLLDPTGLTPDGSASNPFSNSLTPDQQSQLQQQFYVNDLASTLCLNPTYDGPPYGTYTSASRQVDYQLVVAATGQPYNGGPNSSQGPALYPSELQSTQGFGGTVVLQSGVNIGYSSSSSPVANQFSDLLGPGLASAPVTSTQSFIVSGATGIYPAVSAPVNVCYGGNTYGSLGIYEAIINNQAVVLINGLAQLPLGWHP